MQVIMKTNSSALVPVEVCRVLQVACQSNTDNEAQLCEQLITNAISPVWYLTRITLHACMAEIVTEGLMM